MKSEEVKIPIHYSLLLLTSALPPFRPAATSPSRGRLDGRGIKAPHQGEALVRAKLVGAGVPDGPFPRTKNKEMYIPFGIYISLFI